MGLNSFYKFYLDGNLIASDPVNWDKPKFVLERDNVLKGIFLNYIQELEFVGDGYTYLKNKIDTDGFCGEVDFYTYECTPDGSLLSGGFNFKGVIDLSEVKINRYEGKVFANIFNANLSYIINRYKSRKVQINFSGETISGETLNNIGQDITFDIPLYRVVQGDTIFNIFQYIISYLSDNRIDFVSDWFSSEIFQPKIVTATYNALPVVNDTENVTYTNLYGEARTAQMVYDALDAATPQQFFNAIKYGQCFRKTIAASTPHPPSPWPFDVPPSHYKHFQLFHFGDRTQPTAMPFTIDIRDYHDFSYTSDYAASVAVTQSFSDGGANVCMVSAYNIKSGGVMSMNISFSDLFTAMDSIFNLKTTFYIESGRAKLRIEPEAQGYSYTKSVTLNDLKSITETYAEELIYKSLDYSPNVNDSEWDGTIGSFSWTDFQTPFIYDRSFTFEGCGSKERRLEVKPLCFNLSQWADFSGSDNFLFSVNAGTLVAAYEFNTQGFFLDAPIGFDDHKVIVHHITYSAFAIPLLCVKRHLGRLATTLFRFQGITLEADSLFAINRLNKLKGVITPTELNEIVENQNNNIELKSDDIHLRNCWIKKISYNIRSGESDMDLYST